jgi:hypothetical protein
MNNYTWQYIQEHKLETKRLLGIDYEQLEQLMVYLVIWEKRQQEELEKKKIRIIKSGGGRASKLSKENQILLALVYLRHHLNFQLLGIMFQVSESTANNLFHYWQKIIREALPSSLLEQEKKCQEQLEKIIKNLTEIELLVDSEEQEITRPSDYEEQKKYYSGKQSKHTFKNQVTSLPLGQDIVDVVAGEPGPKSDIKICREHLDKFDKKQTFKGDKAYVGELQITTPQKKPKNGELTTEQKTENKKISSVRIFIEHLIRIIKIWRIAQERFRLKKHQYQSIFLTVCGLVRLRIKSLIIEIVKTEDTKEIIDVLLSHSFGQEFNLSKILT